MSLGPLGGEGGGNWCAGLIGEGGRGGAKGTGSLMRGPTGSNGFNEVRQAGV